MGFQKPRAVVMNRPTDEEIKELKKLLQEDAEKFEHQLNLLYTWIDSVPYFPKDYDRNKFMNFLRACKYDMERCKRKIEWHFYVRHSYPQVFSNLNPRSKEIAEQALNGNAMFLPNLTPTGERIFFLGIHNPDVDFMDVMAYVKYSYMCYDLVLREDFPVTRDIMLCDGSNFTMKHFLKCINTAIKDSIAIAYKGYVVRFKAIYIVNAPSAVDKMLAVWKTFLTQKMIDRVIVSKSCDVVQKNIPKHCLPEEYGGTLPKIHQIMRNWYNFLVENEEWFQNQESCKVTERPRDGTIEYSDHFGVEGSFRKLAID